MKTKLLFGIASSMLFVFLGLFLIFEKSYQENTIVNPIIIKVVGIFTVFLFGTMTILNVRKLIKQSF